MLLLMVPGDWSAGYVIGGAVTGGALALEIWWLAANRWSWLPHPVWREPAISHSTEWNGQPEPLDSVGLAAVLEPDRRTAAGLPPLDES